MTLGLYLRGELADALLGPPPAKPTPPPVPVAPVPVAATPPPPPMPPPGTYSGLVVDARGLGVRPAMAPRLISEAGEEVFGRAVVVDRAWATQQGMAGYSRDLAGAQGLFGAAEHRRFLERARVMIVID